MADDNYFKDDLDPVKKESKGFDYTCDKCGKVELKAKSSYNVMGKDLCMDCWFNFDYKKELTPNK